MVSIHLKITSLFPRVDHQTASEQYNNAFKKSRIKKLYWQKTNLTNLKHTFIHEMSKYTIDDIEKIQILVHKYKISASTLIFDS